MPEYGLKYVSRTFLSAFLLSSGCGVAGEAGLVLATGRCRRPLLRSAPEALVALLAAMMVNRKEAIEVEVVKSGEGKGVEVKAVGQSLEGPGIRGRKKRRGGR